MAWEPRTMTDRRGRPRLRLAPKHLALVRAVERPDVTARFELVDERSGAALLDGHGRCPDGEGRPLRPDVPRGRRPRRPDDRDEAHAVGRDPGSAARRSRGLRSTPR